MENRREHGPFCRQVLGILEGASGRKTPGTRVGAGKEGRRGRLRQQEPSSDEGVSPESPGLRGVSAEHSAWKPALQGKPPKCGAIAPPSSAVAPGSADDTLTTGEP